MPTLSIIPDFDLVENSCLSNRTAVPNRIAEFALHRTKEAFDTRIITALRLQLMLVRMPGTFRIFRIYSLAYWLRGNVGSEFRLLKTVGAG